MNNQNLNLIVSYWYRKDKFCLGHSGEFKQKKKSSKQKKKIFVSIKKHKKVSQGIFKLDWIDINSMLGH